MTATYLLRFDDLCPTMNWPVWDRVEALVRAAGIAPILAVIPDNHDPSFHLAPPADDFWERVRGWQAEGWTIGLHGYRHRYVSDQAGLCGTDPRSEFAGVARAEQERKLRAGIDVFDHHGVTVDCWIAPNHSFDATTVDVLRDLGVDVVNDGFELQPHRDAAGTMWVPCQLNELVDKRTGVWTAHLHPNYWADGRVERFAAELDAFAGRFTDLATVVDRYGDRRRDVADAAYVGYRRARSRASRINVSVPAGRRGRRAATT